MKPKNIEQATALIKRYRIIDLTQIQRAWISSARLTAQRLTGISSWDTCSLCKAIKVKCEKCIYQYDMGCIRDEHEKTYDAILGAKTPKGLLSAFRKRADHIEKYMKRMGWL